MYKVFISHSSTNRMTHAAEIRDALYDELTQRNYDVFLDNESIAPGGEWRPEIIEALYSCHVAIVLFDQNAMKSPQVLRELTVLLSRRHMDNSPRIIPVLIGNMTSTELKQKGFTDLGELHFVRAPKEIEGGGQEETEWIVERTTSVFAHLPEKSERMDASWIDMLSCRLRHVPADVRRDSALALGVEPEQCRGVLPPIGGEVVFANQLLDRGGQRGVIKAVEKIYLYHDDKAGLESIVRFLKPSWVNLVSARQLRPAEGSTAPFNFALNASSAKIGEHYLTVAFCFEDSDFDCREISAGHVGENAEEEIRSRMRDRLLEIDPAIEKHGLDNQPRYYLLVTMEGGRPQVALRAARSLQKDFPELVVFLLVGVETRVTDVDVVELEPLDDRTEDNALRFASELVRVSKSA